MITIEMIDRRLDRFEAVHPALVQRVINPLIAVAIVLAFASVTFGISRSFFPSLPQEKGYVEHCIGGVTYIDTGHAITPKLAIDKSLVACHE